MRLILISLSLLLSAITFSQEDSIFLRKIYNEALSEGNAYEDLRSLCKDIGARVTGSAEAEMAVEWGKRKMESYGFDKVSLQEIQVPHWERGTKEAGWIRLKNGELIKVHLLALGGSIGTSGLMESEVIGFNTLEDLKNANKKDGRESAPSACRRFLRVQAKQGLMWNVHLLSSQGHAVFMYYLGIISWFH